MTFIHQKVYRDDVVEKGPRPQLAAFHLETEPWLFVVASDGCIAARLEGSFGVDEFEAAVRRGSSRSRQPPFGDALDDEGGVVLDETDQRRAERMLQVHSKDVEAGGGRHPAAVDRLAALAKNRRFDPGVVGTEPGCPDDDVRVNGPAVTEMERASFGA